MKRFAILTVGIAAGLLSLSQANAAQLFRLSDHPDGAIAPQDYGLRFDNLITSTTNMSFSVTTSEGSPEMFLRVNDDEDEIHIFGKASHNDALYDIDFVYNTNVQTKSDGWRVKPGGSTAVENHGTITGPGLNGVAFYDKANGQGLAFSFRANGHRLSGDNSTFVGWGWVTSDSSHGMTAGTHDWLFIGTPTDEEPPDDNPNTGDGLPEPATAAMGMLGFGVLSLVTRRRGR